MEFTIYTCNIYEPRYVHLKPVSEKWEKDAEYLSLIRSALPGTRDLQLAVHD